MGEGAQTSTTQPSTTQTLTELTGWLGRGVDLFEFDPLGMPNVCGTATAAIGLTKGLWDAWATSCDAKPGFLGFAKEDGLTPIWDLAASAERRDAILQAYMKKAAMVGGGAEVRYGNEQGTLLYASRPDGVNKWAVAAKDHDMSSAATISAYAMGLNAKQRASKFYRIL